MRIMNEIKTRQQILDASKKLFAEHGFNKTTTKMIAEAVGIKKPSLYYFFKNKESIYTSLLKDILEEICNIYTDASEQNLHETITKIFKISKENGAFIFSVDEFGSRPLAEIATTKKELKKRTYEYFKKQSLRCSAKEAIMIVVDISHGYARHVAKGVRVLSPQKYAHLIVDLIQK